MILKKFKLVPEHSEDYHYVVENGVDAEEDIIAIMEITGPLYGPEGQNIANRVVFCKSEIPELIEILSQFVEEK